MEVPNLMIGREDSTAPTEAVGQIPDNISELRRRFLDRPRKRDFFILLIDPRALTRDSISTHISSQAHDVRVLGIVGPGDLSGLPDQAEIDIAVFNIGATNIGEATVIDTIAGLRAALPDIPLAVLADWDDAASVRQGLRLGLRGYIPTDLGVDVMLAAMRLIGMGGIYVPANGLIEAPREEVSAEIEPDPPLPMSFTPRQTQVLRGLRQGKPNKIIAHELQMCESTVKVHVRAIMKKLGASNRTQAAYMVQKGGDWHRPPT